MHGENDKHFYIDVLVCLTFGLCHCLSLYSFTALLVLLLLISYPLCYTVHPGSPSSSRGLEHSKTTTATLLCTDWSGFLLHGDLDLPGCVLFLYMLLCLTLYSYLYSRNIKMHSYGLEVYSVPHPHRGTPQDVGLDFMAT